MHNVFHYLDKNGLDPFQAKLDSIQDRKTCAKILYRIDKMSAEDCLDGYASKNVTGVSELLVTSSSECRIFFCVIDGDIILLFLTIGKNVKHDYIIISEYRDDCIEGERTWLQND